RYACPRTTAEPPRRSRSWPCVSSVALIIHVTQVGAILQYAECHEGEGEDVRSWFQMPTKRLIRSCQGDMRVQDAVGDEAAHADDIRRLGGILDEHVLRREAA